MVGDSSGAEHFPKKRESEREEEALKQSPGRKQSV